MIANAASPLHDGLGGAPSDSPLFSSVRTVHNNSDRDMMIDAALEKASMALRVANRASEAAAQEKADRTASENALTVFVATALVLNMICLALIWMMAK